MKRTDLSIIMRTAWQMCRATGVTFAECLHKAWQLSIKNRIFNNNSSLNFPGPKRPWQ